MSETWWPYFPDPKWWLQRVGFNWVGGDSTCQLYLEFSCCTGSWLVVIVLEKLYEIVYSTNVGVGIHEIIFGN